MAPTGTAVQYLCEENGEPRAALVVQSHSEDCKSLMVFGNWEIGEGSIFRRTSVLRGEEPGHWRPIPEEGG
jgi:hypothetical protein